MSALKLPRKLTRTNANKFLCARIGVRFKGFELSDVEHYDLDKQLIIRKDRIVREGNVEVYWRTKENT